MHGQVKSQNKWRGSFLHHVSKGRPESIAAQAAGVNRQRIIQEKRDDPAFEREIEQARKMRPAGKQVRW